MINALKTEHYSLNVQMLLGKYYLLIIIIPHANHDLFQFNFSGGLLVCVQDSFIKDKEMNKGSSMSG